MTTPRRLTCRDGRAILGDSWNWANASVRSRCVRGSAPAGEGLDARIASNRAESKGVAHIRDAVPPRLLLGALLVEAG
jgi:hypothetical protein